MLLNNCVGISALCFLSLFPIDVTSQNPDKRMNQWKADRIVCSANICDNDCKIQSVNRYTQLISIACLNIRTPLDKVQIHFKLFYRYQRYKPFLIDVDYDVCDYMGDKIKLQPLMDTIMPYVMSKSNFNHPCPYRGDLIVANISLQKSFLKGALIPAGQYRADISVYRTVLAEAIFTVKLYFTVPNGQTTDDMAMG